MAVRLCAYMFTLYNLHAPALFLFHLTRRSARFPILACALAESGPSFEGTSGLLGSVGRPFLRP